MVKATITLYITLYSIRRKLLTKQWQASGKWMIYFLSNLPNTLLRHKLTSSSIICLINIYFFVYDLPHKFIYLKIHFQLKQGDCHHDGTWLILHCEYIANCNMLQPWHSYIWFISMNLWEQVLTVQNISISISYQLITPLNWTPSIVYWWCTYMCRWSRM